MTNFDQSSDITVPEGDVLYTAPGPVNEHACREVLHRCKLLLRKAARLLEAQELIAAAGASDNGNAARGDIQAKLEMVKASLKEIDRTLNSRPPLVTLQSASLDAQKIVNKMQSGGVLGEHEKKKPVRRQRSDPHRATVFRRAGACPRS